MKEEVIRSSILFIVTFLLVYLFYYFWTVKKAKKGLGDPPVEVRYLIYKYKIQLENISYKKLLNTIALVGAFDIALVVSIIANIKGMIIPLIIGFGVLIPVIAITFHFVGKAYQKKGKSENENDKGNRK